MPALRCRPQTSPQAAQVAGVEAGDKPGEYRDSLHAGGVEMLYQPIVDLFSTAAVKVEALARLRLRDGRLVAPAEFLPAFGPAELGVLFGQGLQLSLRSLRAWAANGVELGVCVNLPPVVLSDPACVDLVSDALRSHGVAPARLELELLEQAFDEPVAQLAVLARLRRLGVGLAMDDFGSGHSDVPRLRTVCFDTLKVDRDLTHRVARDCAAPGTRASDLTRLLRRLRHDVVAEGVEDSGSLRAARSMGARFAQGYAIARPMRADAVPGWVRAFDAARHRCATPAAGAA